jgi:DNA-binding HxlR family transcriptional regulator
MTKRNNPKKCPLTASLQIIGGKWKPVIIYNLYKSTKRFGQLDALIPNISRKVLTTQLNELVEDGLVVRTSYAETPPRVEYHLTEKGIKLVPVFNALCEWGKAYASVEVILEQVV